MPEISSFRYSDEAAVSLGRGEPPRQLAAIVVSNHRCGNRVRGINGLEFPVQQDESGLAHAIAKGSRDFTTRVDASGG